MHLGCRYSCSESIAVEYMNIFKLYILTNQILKVILCLEIQPFSEVTQLVFLLEMVINI